MQKLKKKKQMTTLALAFMLTFIIGAAFALTPGILEVEGIINIAPPEELYVVWSRANVGGADITPTPGGITGYGATLGGEAGVVFQDARGRSNQVLVWTVNFDNEEFFHAASLSAWAVNESTQPATIAVRGTPVVQYDTALAAQLGLTITADTSSFLTASLPSSAETGALSVDVFWNGAPTIPDPGSPGSFIPAPEGHEFEPFEITIEFDYFPTGGAPLS